MDGVLYFSYSVLVTKWRVSSNNIHTQYVSLLRLFPGWCEGRLRSRWSWMMSTAMVGAKMKWEINWWWHHSDAPAVWVSALSQRRNRIAPHRTNPLPRRDKSSALRRNPVPLWHTPRTLCHPDPLAGTDQWPSLIYKSILTNLYREEGGLTFRIKVISKPWCNRYGVQSTMYTAVLMCVWRLLD